MWERVWQRPGTTVQEGPRRSDAETDLYGKAEGA